jgi:pre-mRNA-splicing factor SYF1
MDRRPFLVNDVHLRQNPNNVAEWGRRAKLYLQRHQHDKVTETFNEAVATIQPRKASGELHMLWVQFAQYYETGGRGMIEKDAEDEEDKEQGGNGGDDDDDDAMQQDGGDKPGAYLEPNLDAARQVFERAVKVPYQTVDHLAEVWCQWAEMELRNEEFDAALMVMGRATAPPRGLKHNLHHTIKFLDESLSPQQRLFKSLKLWSFYVDWEESIGSVESTRAAYDRILELKIANAQVLCNYAAFLEDNKWFEEVKEIYFFIPPPHSNHLCTKKIHVSNNVELQGV